MIQAVPQAAAANLFFFLFFVSFMKKKREYPGIEIIISGITAIAILVGFKIFMPSSSCGAEITKIYNIFFIFMFAVATISTSYGMYILTKAVLKRKK